MGRGKTKKADGSCFPMTGERGLIAAVLTRAIYDAAGARFGNQCQSDYNVPQREALQWLYSDVHTRFSYVWICEYLGFPPKKLRKKISKLLVEQKITYFHEV